MENKNIDLIMQYKELLDSGVITKEEFEAKKKQILDSEPVHNASYTTTENNDGFVGYNSGYTAPVDSGSFGWAVLGFFFPLVGLILWLVWKDTKPLSAKKAGIGALVSVIVSVVVSVLCTILTALFAGVGAALY